MMPHLKMSSQPDSHMGASLPRGWGDTEEGLGGLSSLPF